jgi:biotin-dependent carboxylase-like uncharacterized protein
MLEIVEPGLLSTVQDGGRPGTTDLGVPIGGACDAWSLAVANVLLGNEPDEAALEITVVGPALLVLRRCTVALAGADLGARVMEEGRPIAPGTVHLVHPGTRIAFGRVAGDLVNDGARAAGARAYLAIAGGVDVEPVLGSRGTCLAGGFGGFGGRPLRAGDRIVPRRPHDVSAAGRRWPAGIAGPAHDGPVRLLPGPPALGRPLRGAFAALLGTTWRVAPESDRMGLRLEGPPIAADDSAAGRLPSRGVLPGAIQVPPGGRPIVLLADAQTVGGYPVAGVVPTVDLPILAQLRPGGEFRFMPTTLDEARAAQHVRRSDLVEARRLLAAAEDWNAVAEGVG